MNLQERLTETLRDRADAALPPPELATRAAARGRVLRRRRQIAVAATPLVAQVAIAMGTSAITGFDRAAEAPTPAPPVELPPGPQPPRPFAVTMDFDGTRNHRSVHFGTTDVALPDLADPAELWPAGNGVVVGVAAYPNERWRASDQMGREKNQLLHVDGQGVVRRLPGLTWPAAVSPDGRRLAALDENDASRLVEIELPSGRQVRSVSGRLTPLAYIAGQAGEYRLLASEDVNDDDRNIEELRIWEKGTLHRLPLTLGLDAGVISDVVAGGDTLAVARPNRLDVYRIPPTGTTLTLAWSRPRPVEPPPFLRHSPDGEVLAVPEGERGVFLDAHDGRVVSRTQPIPPSIPPPGGRAA